MAHVTADVVAQSQFDNRESRDLQNSDQKKLVASDFLSQYKGFNAIVELKFHIARQSTFGENSNGG